MKVQLLNKIAAVGTDKLDKAVYTIGADVENPDAIMVRSAAMHDMEFGPELKAIARAGAGVNNIPLTVAPSRVSLYLTRPVLMQTA